MKGSQKPKKTGKKPAQKSLKERRTEKRAAAKTDALARRLTDRSASLGRRGQHGVEQVVELRGRDADRRVGRAVVEPDLAARPSWTRPHGKTTFGTSPIRSYGASGREDPLRQPVQHAGRLVEVEQCKADPVDAAADDLLDAVVDQQPAVLGSSGGGPMPMRSASHQAPSRGCRTCSGALQLTRSAERESRISPLRRRRTRSSGGGRGSTCRRSGAAAAPRSCPPAAGRSRGARRS